MASGEIEITHIQNEQRKNEDAQLINHLNTSFPKLFSQDTTNSSIPTQEGEHLIKTNLSKSENSLKKSELNNEKSKPFNIFMDTPFILRIFMIDMLKLILNASQDTKKLRVLTTQNLPSLSPQHSIPLSYQRFLTNIQTKKDAAKKQNRELNAQDMLYVFLKTFRKDITISIVFNSIGYLAIFGYSLLIDMLISHIQSNGVGSKAYWIAAALCILVISSVLCDHNILRVNAMVVSMFKSIFMKLLYSKISSLSAFSVKEANVGKLVNLISNDMSTIEQKANIMFAVLSIPLPLIAVTTFLILKYGLIGLLGIGIMMALCPLQLFFSKLNSEYFSEKTKYTDLRVNLTNEIVEGIRLIKMYAWEEAFIHSINSFRKIELKKIFISTLITALDYGVSNSFSLFGTFIIFYVQYHYGDSSVLDTALLYTTLNMLNFVKSQVVQVIGYGTSGIFSLNIILERMVDVINLKETSMAFLEDESQDKQITIQKGNVEFTDFTAFWKENNPILQNINLSIRKGECVCILGKVGSGKSTFLNCLLREVPFYQGHLKFAGKLAYVEQEPYIFSNTVKENIIFGSQYNEEFYNKVISVCCLEQDIKTFQYGDETQIGERGVNLSGGQKARISLARAIYSQADIYLLDDPLSAVDSKVAKVLFFDAIKTLCKDSTILLVTHQTHFAQYCDKIVILDSGEIQKQGAFVELEESLKILSSELHHDDDNFLDKINENEGESINEQVVLKHNSNGQENDTEIEDGGNELFEKEEDSVVNSKTYLEFFSSSGILYLISVITILYASSDVVYVFYNKQLGKFNASDDKSGLINLTGYLLLTFFVIQIIKNISLCLAINKASKQLLHKMITSLMRSKVFYFDTTPTGRILNRFSTDIGLIDENLTMILVDIIEILIGISVLFITIMTITLYFILVTAFEFGVLLMFLRYCKEGLIQTKQIDLKTRSPLMSFFSLTIQGVLPIKVYGQKENFEKTFDSLAHDSLRASFYYWISQRGFGGFIHLFATICNSIGIFLLISVTNQPSSIGQSIIFFLTGTELLQWGIRQIVQLDVAMTSAQRCLNITKLDSEPPLRTQYDYNEIQTEPLKKIQSPQQKSDINLVVKGQLTFQNVKMRYRKEADLVLNNLSFAIQPGMRVGIIGRTGAGKSSIIQALFRMVELDYEPNMDEGIIDVEHQRLSCDIVIDGHSIKNLGLHTLRSAISIIPQVPFIFSGTIRQNLDPLHQYTDEDIYQILEDVELFQKISSLEKKLDEEMNNANDIFSTGQKQLICLGRALLRKNRLIVLDEATSNIDMLTDQLIQRKIRQRFSDSTVITIAHRLNTIADYDEVFVIDNGQVVEKGSPYQLLFQNKGVFYDMVQHTGLKNAQLISHIAQQAFSNKI